MEVEAENKAAQRENAAAKVQDLEKELEVFFFSFLKPKTLSPKPTPLHAQIQTLRTPPPPRSKTLKKYREHIL